MTKEQATRQLGNVLAPAIRTALDLGLTVDEVLHEVYASADSAINDRHEDDQRQLAHRARSGGLLP